MAADRLTHLIEAYSRLDALKGELEIEHFNAKELKLERRVPDQLGLVVNDLSTAMNWLDECIQEEKRKR